MHLSMFSARLLLAPLNRFVLIDMLDSRALTNSNGTRIAIEQRHQGGNFEENYPNDVLFFRNSAARLARVCAAARTCSCVLFEACNIRATSNAAHADARQQVFAGMAEVQRRISNAL